MPEPIAIARRVSLTQDVLNDNADLVIPDDIYVTTVKPLLDEINSLGVDPYTAKFDPKRHILYTDADFDKTKRVPLSHFGYDEFIQEPISDTALSFPFPLFTDECIALMRWEIFQYDTLKKYGRISTTSTTGDKDFYVRGYAGQKGSFAKQAWTHPMTQGIINKMCGVELVPQIDYEIGHINLAIKQKDSKVLDISEMKAKANEVKAIVPWHYDSPQFVCVLMLSDTSKMIGGETAVMAGDGSIIRADGPKKGWATILQGRILKHMATKPVGEFTERITSVTSYRPVDVLLDKTAITTVKPGHRSGSRYNDFYQEYMNYRLDILTQRLLILKDQINTSIDKGEKFNQLETIDFLEKKITLYCNETWQEFEVVDDALVPRPSTYNVARA